VIKFHELFNSIWNKGELTEQWTEFIIIPIHKKGGKTYCNKYCGIPLLSTSYKMLSNIFLSLLIQYIDEIIGDNQCWFQCKSSTTDHNICIHQILEKKWEYNETVQQLFTDFKKDYDSVRMELFYSILIEFAVLMKLVRLIKIHLNETYSTISRCKHLSDNLMV
jgi:hypothetical protein